MGLVELAEQYCLHYHDGQKRKGGNQEPYYTHPFAVRDILVRYGYTDEETLAIALLHDTIEDTKLRERKREIRERFGDAVYQGVYILSNNTVSKDAAALIPLFTSLGVQWIGGDGNVHPDAYKLRLLTNSNNIKRVKVADMIHNTRSLPELSAKGIARKIKDAELFYIPLGHIVAPIMVKELEQNIALYKASVHYQQTLAPSQPYATSS